MDELELASANRAHSAKGQELAARVMASSATTKQDPTSKTSKQDPTSKKIKVCKSRGCGNTAIKGGFCRLDMNKVEVLKMHK